MGSVMTDVRNGEYQHELTEKQRAFATLLREKYQPADRDACDLVVRPLRAEDFGDGYCELLAQLTTVGQVTQEHFTQRFREMMASDSYFIAVVQDHATGRIVASATLLLEWKFIHACGVRGRVEDVVVDAEARRHSLGSLLNRALVDAAANLFGVYKLSLECKNELIPFYERFGYHVDANNNFLVQRFRDD